MFEVVRKSGLEGLVAGADQKLRRAVPSVSGVWPLSSDPGCWPLRRPRGPQAKVFQDLLHHGPLGQEREHGDDVRLLRARRDALCAAREVFDRELGRNRARTLDAAHGAHYATLRIVSFSWRWILGKGVLRHRRPAPGLSKSPRALLHPDL